MKYWRNCCDMHFNYSVDVYLCLEIVFQVALDKLFRFATTKVFESETAGQMCCDMCAAAAKVQYYCTD